MQIQNDGEDVDSFTFGGAGSDSLFTVRYLSGYYDITAKVIADEAIIRNVPPGGVRTIAVQITVAQDGAAGNRHRIGDDLRVRDRRELGHHPSRRAAQEPACLARPAQPTAA